GAVRGGRSSVRRGARTGSSRGSAASGAGTRQASDGAAARDADRRSRSLREVRTDGQGDRAAVLAFAAPSRSAQGARAAGRVAHRNPETGAFPRGRDAGGELAGAGPAR